MGLASENNIKSPSTYGKEAYQKYRKKEKHRHQSRPLGQNYKQKRTKIVTDIHYETIIAQLLKELRFPAKKEKIIQFILENKSSSVSRVQTVDILSLMQQIQEKKYKTVAELTEAVDLLQDIS